MAMQALCRYGKQYMQRQRSFFSTVRYYDHGTPLEVLKVEEDDVEKRLGKYQVALRFLAAPINPADLNMIQGGYGIEPTFPAVGGNEGVAEVVDVGRKVEEVEIGDRVVPHGAGLGTWRNFAVAHVDSILKIPSDIPIEAAATLSVNPCTAYRLLCDFETLDAGDVIIQNGANSSVGQAVIQLAALSGIQTINIVRQGSNYEEVNEHLKGLGGTIVCPSGYAGTAAFKRMISDLPAPKLALNLTGGPDATTCVRALAPGGTMVTYGGMSRQPVTIPTSALIFKDIKLRGFWMSKWIETHTKEERIEMLDRLIAVIRQDKLRTWMVRYPFSNFTAAVTDVVEQKTKRKVLLMMDETDL